MTASRNAFIILAILLLLNTLYMVLVSMQSDIGVRAGVVKHLGQLNSTNTIILQTEALDLHAVLG